MKAANISVQEREGATGCGLAAAIAKAGTKAFAGA
jgi:hypothetical protein